MMPLVSKGSCLVVKLWAVPVADASSAYLADLATFATPLHHGCSEYPQAPWDPYRLDLFADEYMEETVKRVHWTDIEDEHPDWQDDEWRYVFPRVRYEVSIGEHDLDELPKRGEPRFHIMPWRLDY